MLNKSLSRLMLIYLCIYFGIAAEQFVLFAFVQGMGWMYFAGALLWIALLVYGANRVPDQRAWYMFGLIGLVTKTLWIIFVQTPAISDYSLMYNSALEIVRGQSEYLNNIYYQRFPYQLGFTSYQALLLAIAESPNLLKLVNVAWCTVASLAVYGIAREAYSKRVAALAMLLHVTLLPLLVLSSVLTNQHIAVAWFYVGIYLWMKAGWRSWPLAVAAGAALAIGNAMRPIGIVIVAAIAVNALIHLLQNRSREIWGQAARAAATIASYAAVLFLISTLLIQTGISPDGLRNNDPLWKFVAGLNAEMNGTYSTADEKLLNYGYMEPEQRTAREREIIAERLTNMRNMVTLPFIKIGKMWADYQPDWFTFPHMTGHTFSYLGWTVEFDEVLTRYRYFERAVFYILAVAAFAGIIRFVRHRFTDDKPRLLMLIVGAYTFVHLLVEVQSRYLYFLFGILLIFSAAELLRTSDSIAKKRGDLIKRSTS